MAISRSQLVKELEPGLNALFGLEYKRYENQHAEIYTTESSDRAFEEEVMLSGFANAQTKAEGQGVSFDNATESYTARYSHDTVSLAFALTEEAIEDNLYDSLGKRYTKSLARSMKHSKEVKAASVLNNAFSSSFTGGDGVSLINTAHPLAGGGTEANRATTMADLNETSLEANLVDLATFTDDRGLQISVMPSKLVIPPQLVFVADRLLSSDLRTGTSDNDINAIVSMGMIPQGYRVNNYLTDSDAFYILTDVPNGMKMFNRAPLTTAMEGDFDTGNVRYKARERYSFGVSDPRGIFGVEGV